MRVRKQIPTATVTHRDVVIGSASIAFLGAIHAAGNTTKSGGNSINKKCRYGRSSCMGMTTRLFRTPTQVR